MADVATAAEGPAPAHRHDDWPDRRSAVLTPLSHAVHVAWWIAAAVALFAGVTYLVRGAPEVALALGVSFEGAFTVAGLTGTALSAAAGVLAPVGGAAIGLIPGCGPQIVLASVYAEGGIPFSALVANAISQDGDALFPLIAIDKRAAVVASIYTTIPALVVGVAVYVLWPMLGLPSYGFGVIP